MLRELINECKQFNTFLKTVVYKDEYESASKHVKAVKESKLTPYTFMTVLFMAVWIIFSNPILAFANQQVTKAPDTTVATVSSVDHNSLNELKILEVKNRQIEARHLNEILGYATRQEELMSVIKSYEESKKTSDKRIAELEEKSKSLEEMVMETKVAEDQVVTKVAASVTSDSIFDEIMEFY